MTQLISIVYKPSYLPRLILPELLVVLLTWDIGEHIPDRTKPIIHLILTVTIIITPVFVNGFLEAEIDPGPIAILRQMFYFKDLSSIFRTWIAYIQETTSLLVAILTMPSPTRNKVPKDEIDPGPYRRNGTPSYTNKNLVNIIVHEAIVVFMTWIGYIRNPSADYYVPIVLTWTPGV